MQSCVSISDYFTRFWFNSEKTLFRPSWGKLQFSERNYTWSKHVAAISYFFSYDHYHNTHENLGQQNKLLAPVKGTYEHWKHLILFWVNLRASWQFCKFEMQHLSWGFLGKNVLILLGYQGLSKFITDKSRFV